MTSPRARGGGPRLSVLMGVHDAEPYLREAVDSLLAQTFTDFEAIVVDDGSRDGSADILASYQDRRLRILRNPKNAGLPATLNRALGVARAPLLARMDADDVAAPDRFTRQVAVMDARPELDVLGSWTVEIDEAGEETGRFSFPACEALIRWGMARTNVVYHPTVLMRREMLERVDGYRAAVDVADDYDLFTRILMAGGRIDLVPERLLRYRRHADQASAARVARQHEQAAAVRHRYVRWLAGANAPVEVVDAAAELQEPGGASPPGCLLEPALALSRAIRAGAAAGAGPAGHRRVQEHARRALLAHAARLRADGRRADGFRVWRESLRGPRAWRDPEVLAGGLAFFTFRRGIDPAASAAE